MNTAVREYYLGFLDVRYYLICINLTKEAHIFFEVGITNRIQIRIPTPVLLECRNHKEDRK
jgi:hypothetical protein